MSSHLSNPNLITSSGEFFIKQEEYFKSSLDLPEVFWKKIREKSEKTFSEVNRDFSIFSSSPFPPTERKKVLVLGQEKI